MAKFNFEVSDSKVMVLLHSQATLSKKSWTFTHKNDQIACHVILIRDIINAPKTIQKLNPNNIIADKITEIYFPQGLHNTIYVYNALENGSACTKGISKNINEPFTVRLSGDGGDISIVYDNYLYNPD